jgi:hypothetical protein
MYPNDIAQDKCMYVDCSGSDNLFTPDLLTSVVVTDCAHFSYVLDRLNSHRAQELIMGVCFVLMPL